MTGFFFLYPIGQYDGPDTFCGLHLFWYVADLNKTVKRLILHLF